MSQQATGTVYDGQMVRRLLAYLAPYKLVVALSFVLVLVVSVLRLLRPILVKIAIDEFISVGNLLGLNLIALVFVLALFLQFAISYVQVYVMHVVGQRVMADMRREIFSHLQNLPASFFDRNPVGRLVTRVTTDVDALNELLTSGVVAIFGDVFMLVGTVGVLIYLDWRLALVTFAVLPALFSVVVVFKHRVRVVYRELRTRIAMLNAFIQENIVGMSVVQLFCQEHRKFNEHTELNREHTEANIESIRLYSLFYPLASVLGAIAIALIVRYGGGRIERQTLTLGTLVAFIQYSERFFQPINDLFEKFNILQGALAASERIFGFLDSRTAIRNPERPIVPERRDGSIAFANVSFAYEAEDWVLRGIDLDVRPGEMVAIVGHTGAGKSTLMNLLIRLYDVQRGRVLVDGVDVRDWDLESLRRQFGIVLQDVHLFSGTIASNIRLGDTHISDEAVAAAAAAANLNEWLATLPGGLNEEVLEHGASFSAGRKQLVSFARALVRDPKILILDEATSNIDSHTEILVREALERLLEKRSSIVIAHRLSTIQKANRIVVLHKGRVREVGTHQELLAERGIYFRLYQLQYQDEEREDRG